MVNSIINYSIVTNEQNRAYAFSNKFKLLGINLDYITSTSEMLKQMLKNDQSIIIVDMDSKELISLIEEFNHTDKNQNFNFIFLTDRITNSIEIDNSVTFKCSTNELFKFIPKVIYNLAETSIKKMKYSRLELEDKIHTMLVSFGISRSLGGFRFLSDAIKINSGFTGKNIISANDVYNEIGKKYDKKSANIEKSIRFALSKASENPTKTYSEYFAGEKLTNYKFITQMTVLLKDFFKDLNDK